MTLHNMKAELFRVGIKQAEVANFLGMTASNFNRKLAECVPMTVDEAKAIRNNFLDRSSLDYLLESDGDRPGERERLHHCADAIESALTADGSKPDEEASRIAADIHGIVDERTR